jgi:hypothetical protein
LRGGPSVGGVSAPHNTIPNEQAHHSGDINISSPP